MPSDFLDDRRSALEEAFFAQQTEAWRRQHREADAAKTKREALAAASGIGDAAVLDRLAGLGLQADTLAALSLVPLVVVAWADGTLDDKERAALLAAAADAGIARGGDTHALLTQWLSAPPPATLLTAWSDYVGALAPDARQALKPTVLGRARAVAESAGGFLGLGSKVSPAEDAALARLERAFG